MSFVAEMNGRKLLSGSYNNHEGYAIEHYLKKITGPTYAYNF